MLKRVTTLTLTFVLALSFALPVWAQDNAEPIARAADFLLTVQNEDGGFPNGFAPESDLGTTADAVLALGVAGVDFEETFADAPSPLDYLADQLETNEEISVGQLAKITNALVAVGADPSDFADQDVVAAMLDAQTDAGTFGGGPFDHCLVMTALQNAGVDVPEEAITALLDAQTPEGGWGFAAEMAADTNSTALCVQALAVYPQATESPVSQAIVDALDYLVSIQNEDGGWPYQNPSEYGTDSDTNSTALVVQALIAADVVPETFDTSVEWLLGMQQESGAFAYQAAFPDDNILATVAVIPALAGSPLNAWAPMPEEEAEAAQ